MFWPRIYWHVVPAISLPKSMHRNSLAGQTILVTRPEHQAEHLCRLIEQAGGQAIRLPVLIINDSSSTSAVTETLSHLGDYDLAIFISPNAVRFGLDAVDRAGGLPVTLQLAAVGKGTARALTARTGRSLDLVPEERFDSESLLALDAMQQMAGKRVVIIRGNGGREHLAETLRQRGAQVDYTEVYQRLCPTALPEDDDRLDKADIITTTSCEGLDNLVAMTPVTQHRRLFATPLLVVSDRARVHARELGFQAECLLSPLAADEAIVETLMNREQQPPN